MANIFADIGNANVLDTVIKGTALYKNIADIQESEAQRPFRDLLVASRTRDAVLGDIATLRRPGEAGTHAAKGSVPVGGIVPLAGTTSNAWAAGAGAADLPPSKAATVPIGEQTLTSMPDRAVEMQQLQQAKADNDAKLKRIDAENKNWDYNNDELLKDFLPISKDSVIKLLKENKFIDESGKSTQGMKGKALQMYAEDKNFGDKIDQMRAQDAKYKYETAQAEADKLYAESLKATNLGNPEHQIKLLEARRKAESALSEYQVINQRSSDRIGMRELLPVAKSMAEKEGITMEDFVNKPEIVMAQALGSPKAMEEALNIISKQQQIEEVWNTLTPEEKAQGDIRSAKNFGDYAGFNKAIQSYRAQIEAKLNQEAARLRLQELKGEQQLTWQKQKDEAAMKRELVKGRFRAQLKSATDSVRDPLKAHKLYMDYEKQISALRREQGANGDPYGYIQDRIDEFNLAQQNLVKNQPGLQEIFKRDEAQQRKQEKIEFTGLWNDAGKRYADARNSGNKQNEAVAKADLEDLWLQGQSAGLVAEGQDFESWLSGTYAIRKSAPKRGATAPPES